MKMKELNRRQFFNLLITGTAAFVGVKTASAAKKTFTAVDDYLDSASSLPGSIHDNLELKPIDSNVGSRKKVMLAQYGSIRRSSRRTARRTARRTTRRVNRRREIYD
jgi:hypothetical protein